MDIYLTPQQASKVINVSIATLKKFIYQGKLKTLKTPGGHHRILKSDIFKIAYTEKNMHYSKLTTNQNISEIIEQFLTSMKEKQVFLKNHAFRVAELSFKIAEALKLSASHFYKLYIASLLHDIGLLHIDREIINKTSPLNEKEYAMIKTHPALGENIANSIEQLKEISEIIRQHHERYDGNGYPNGLENDQICLEARIINIVEAFDCMTASDSYKKNLSQEEALNEIEMNRGTQFDTTIADAFIKLFKSR